MGTVTLHNDSPQEMLTCLHRRMYWVICVDGGAFHWMGWESGWLPDSVMITCTGRWLPRGGTQFRNPFLLRKVPNVHKWPCKFEAAITEIQSREH